MHDGQRLTSSQACVAVPSKLAPQQSMRQSTSSSAGGLRDHIYGESHLEQRNKDCCKPF